MVVKQIKPPQISYVSKLQLKTCLFFFLSFHSRDITMLWRQKYQLRVLDAFMNS